jgi:hypothetical protein
VRPSGAVVASIASRARNWQKLCRLSVALLTVIQLDLNSYFAALERTQVPQVRLKQLTVDANAQTMQATYDVADSTLVAHITQVLNSNDKVFSWTLKTLSDWKVTYTASLSKRY